MLLCYIRDNNLYFCEQIFDAKSYSAKWLVIITAKKI